MIDTLEMDTDKVLKEAEKYARKNNIKDIIVASTTGETGVKASKMFKNDYKLIVVTHSTGFKEKKLQELTKKNRKIMEKNGAKIYTGTMIFHSWNDYYRKKTGSISSTTIIADVLRMFGQGTKVAVEIATMAADAGLITMEPVISIGGTSHGADTVLLINPENSNRLFDTHIMEIIAKPSNW